MISNFTQATQRRKAVWGPKRALATVALVAIGLAPNAMASGTHRHAPAKAKAGLPHSSGKGYKLDKALTGRSNTGNPLHTSTLILRLVPGAALPLQCTKFRRHRPLH